MTAPKSEAKTAADETPDTLAEAEAARDAAVADAEAKAAKAVDAVSAADDKKTKPVEAAIDAAKDAVEAQGDVDRAEQKIRAGGIAPSLEQRQYKGVPNDAFGGPTEEER